MNEDKLSLELKAAALFPNEEDDLVILRARVGRARRTRLVTRSMLAVAVLAIVALAAVKLFDLMRPLPTVVISDQEVIETTTAPSQNGTTAEIQPAGEGLQVPGVQRIVGVDQTGVWIVTEDSTRKVTLGSGADLQRSKTSTGTKGDHVVLGAIDSSELSLWRAEAPGELTDINDGGRYELVQAEVSPEESAVAIVRNQTGDSDLYLHDLVSGITKQLHWPTEEKAGGHMVTKLLWAADGSTLHISVGEAGGDTGTYSYRYDLAAESFTELVGLAEIYSIGPDGEVLGCELADVIPASKAPLGIDSSSRPLAVWRDGSLERIVQDREVQKWGAGIISPDGQLVAIMCSYSEDSTSAIEIFRRSGEGWEFQRLVTFPGVPVAWPLTFSGDGNSLWYERDSGVDGPSPVTRLCRLDLHTYTTQLEVEMPFADVHAIRSLVLDPAGTDAGATSVQTSITGDPGNIQAPPETLILQLPKGTEPGEFGFSTAGDPMDIPFAISPDSSMIAINDWVNCRVLLYGMDGTEKSSFDTPKADPESYSVYRQMVFVDSGHLVLGRIFWDIVDAYDGTIVDSIEYGLPQNFHADTLLQDGNDVWISGLDDSKGDITCSYPIILDGQALSAEQSIAHEKPAPVSAEATFYRTKKSEQEYVTRIEPFSGGELTWTVSSQLLIDTGYVVGTDAAGGYFLLFSLAVPGGGYCLTGISKTGEYLGQVVWPYTYYHGGSIQIGPDGAVYECRTTPDGIELVRFELTKP